MELRLKAQQKKITSVFSRQSPSRAFPAKEAAVGVHEAREAEAVAVQGPLLALAIVCCQHRRSCPRLASPGALVLRASQALWERPAPLLEERLHGPWLDRRPLEHPAASAAASAA
eukprot:CAMPEP_0172598578 /NCGR_PEP_ID=MMETSP1068-20121228/18627_1 /TAXON_ID=35684 /ORGANISM="Pseudopedinella elastica, Strain CCMP716" /LENGTH=114 /DNA_ID=CAMNT_0013398495 /DNA_START=114 /DNA_END=455 /DNA_ORIENTATION=-